MDKDNNMSPERIPTPEIISVKDSLRSFEWMDPDVVSEILSDISEVPLKIFEDDPNPISEVKPETIAGLTEEDISKATQELVSELQHEPFSEIPGDSICEITDENVSDIIDAALFENELQLQPAYELMPEFETLPVIQPEETSPPLLIHSEPQDLLPDEISITEPLPAMEIIAPGPLSVSIPEPILEPNPEILGEEDQSSGGTSSSSNSDILISTAFKDESSYYIPNKCQKNCSFEQQVHAEPSTSRTWAAPKVIIKKRCTRRATREEEIKKENYRKFQEEMDKIEIVKDDDTITEEVKRVSTSPPKVKAKKIAKKVIQTKETSPPLLIQSEPQDLLPQQIPITETLPVMEIIAPEPLAVSTSEPILEPLTETLGEEGPSPGRMSSSSNSDILISPAFKDEPPYYIPNKCQKMCNFEYQVHAEPSTSRTWGAPKVIIKRRCTRRSTREEEFKKENYRKFQEEMDKIEIVKDDDTLTEEVKRVSTSPSKKPKAKKITKKVTQSETSLPILIHSEPQDLLPEEIPMTEPLPAKEISAPEPLAVPTPEPILEPLTATLGEEGQSLGGMSSSSNSDILISPAFKDEPPYYIPNKCQKMCSFEYQVHAEPPTSRRWGAPKVIIKRRCTRRSTREKEIKKQNYRKFQEEMDKIEIVKDDDTINDEVKRVSNSPPKKPKAKKITKKVTQSETSLPILIQSEPRYLLPEEIPMTEPLPAMEISAPEPLAVSTLEPILEPLTETLGEEGQSPGRMSSSSNSDILISPAFKDEPPYYIPNKCKKMCSFEYQVHAEPSTSRTWGAPKVIIKRRFTRKSTKEEEIKKENYRKFQEEMDKIEIVKDDDTITEEVKRVSTSPPKPKAKKITKKVIQPEETSPPLLIQSEPQYLLHEAIPITEPLPAIEIMVPEHLSVSTPEPMHDTLPEILGEEGESPDRMSCSSNSDISISSEFEDEPQYYIPNTCQKRCSFEYAAYAEPSTSRTWTAPKVIMKKRFTRRATREEEIKKENYRKFQEEIDKIVIVKDVDTTTEKVKRVSTSPPIPKAKKITKKVLPKSKKAPEPKKRTEPPKRLSKRKQAHPKKITQ